MSRYAITAQVLRMIASSPYAGFRGRTAGQPGRQAHRRAAWRARQRPSSSAPATTDGRNGRPPPPTRPPVRRRPAATSSRWSTTRTAVPPSPSSRSRHDRCIQASGPTTVPVIATTNATIVFGSEDRLLDRTGHSRDRAGSADATCVHGRNGGKTPHRGLYLWSDRLSPSSVHRTERHRAGPRRQDGPAVHEGLQAPGGVVDGDPVDLDVLGTGGPGRTA